MGIQLAEDLFEKAGRRDIDCLFSSSDALGTAFFFHEVGEITQRVAILDLIQIPQEEVVENLKVEVNSSEKDHKNDKFSILPLNCE